MTLDLLLAIGVLVLGGLVAVFMFNSSGKTNKKHRKAKKAVAEKRDKKQVEKKQQPLSKKEKKRIQAEVFTEEPKFRQSGMRAEKFKVIKMEDLRKDAVTQEKAQAVAAAATQKQRERDEAAGFQVQETVKPKKAKNQAVANSDVVVISQKEHFDGKLNQFFRSQKGDKNKKKGGDRQANTETSKPKAIIKAGFGTSTRSWGEMADN